MENLNDLIWTDEDDNSGISTQNIMDGPMRDICLICLCMTDSSRGGYIGMGSNYACIRETYPGVNSLCIFG